MHNETPTKDNAEIFQEICLKLDALLQKGFSDAALVREQVRILVVLSIEHGRLLDIATQVGEIFADAVPESEDTKRRIFEVVKNLGNAIANAQKVKVAPSKGRPVEAPSPLKPGPRRFKDTLPYGQLPPLEEPHLLPKKLG